MSQKNGRTAATITFPQHVDFGIQLNAVIQSLNAMRSAAAAIPGAKTRPLRSSLTKALAAIDAVRNDAENLLCSTVPDDQHTQNPCTVYYGLFIGGVRHA